jgi:4-amino-4-deoxy-L-arabinose transferase-like glycosyltransferase
MTDDRTGNSHTADTPTADPPTAGVPSDVDPPSWTARLVRGRPDDPAWVRPALLALLAGTAVLYLWGLSNNGWANAFYSAAAQAGSRSWKAFFFGSSDAGNWITVDKPPLSLWPMDAAVRIFGLNPWSVLVPQALMGVATVGVVYATVRRWFGPVAGLLSGLFLALTPVAALMFRFNNPDSLLTLLMAIAAYTALRAVEDDRLRWYVLTGVAIGLGFLTKQLQVLLVVPAFALALLVAGRGTVWRRVRGLLVAGGAMVLGAAWWFLAVELFPADQRPYIGGSQHNSILELTLGYNGLGRLTGNEVGSVGGGPAVPGAPGAQAVAATRTWGQTGINRMFGSVIGGQISWLIPAALVALVACLWLGRRAPRTDLRRASLLVWGGWLVGTGLVFSFMAGIFHEYYTVALAPAIGALAGIGAAAAWERRRRPAALAVVAATTAFTAWWATVLLDRAPRWNPWLADVVVVVGASAVVALVLTALAQARGRTPSRVALGAVGALALAAVLLAPSAWVVQTVRTSHTGSLVAAGPKVVDPSRRHRPVGAGTGGPPGSPGQAPAGVPSGAGSAGSPPVPPAHHVPDRNGGLLQASRPTAPVVERLLDHAGRYEWAAAVVGSMRAAGYQLATQRPVIAIGGFNGTDPSPTLEEFQDLVAAGRVHWFIGSSTFRNQMGGSSEAARIGGWVEANYTATQVGTTVMYDLTAGLPKDR